MMFRKPLILAAATALAFTAHPASAEVIASSEAGFVTRATAEVPADPAATWAALIAPQNWWNKAHTFSGDPANLYLDAQGGGCFCEKLPLKDGAPGSRGGSVSHMRVVYADPGKALRMVGSLGPLQSEALTGTLTITLKPADPAATGAGTRIVLEYVVGGYMRYKVEDIAPAVDRVLVEQLAGLAAALGAVEEPTASQVEPAKPKPKSKPAPKP